MDNGYSYKALLAARDRRFQPFPFLRDHMIGPVRMKFNDLLLLHHKKPFWSGVLVHSGEKIARLFLRWCYYEFSVATLTWLAVFIYMARGVRDNRFVSTKVLHSESGENLLRLVATCRRTIQTSRDGTDYSVCSTISNHFHCTTADKKNCSCFVPGASHMKECNRLCLPK